jgi:hypothetical protein
MAPPDRTLVDTPGGQWVLVTGAAPGLSDALQPEDFIGREIDVVDNAWAW